MVVSINEVANFDLEAGVSVTDEDKNVNLTYDNTLKAEVGSYIITYEATDSSGNKATRKRLIKVE